MKKDKITPEEDRIIRLAEAYRILSSEVYIPEKYQEGYIKFARKLKDAEDCPTNIKILALKVELDDLIEYYIPRIYELVKLK
ncbi:MAG: hypothetical protein M1308_24165 [Actinobacteria bacterium]|nr:hypothetical protein [Actinomycetota bacterium]